MLLHDGYLMTISLFCFFLIHTVTQMESTTQLRIMPALILATAMIKFVSDNPSGKREDDDSDPIEVTYVSCI